MKNYCDEYYTSPHFVDLKERSLAEYPICMVCGANNAYTLHHLNYDHLYEEKLFEDVIPICRGCHARIHNKSMSNSIFTFNQEDIFPSGDIDIDRILVPGRIYPVAIEDYMVALDEYGDQSLRLHISFLDFNGTKNIRIFRSKMNIFRQIFNIPLIGDENGNLTLDEKKIIGAFGKLKFRWANPSEMNYQVPDI